MDSLTGYLDSLKGVFGQSYRVFGQSYRVFDVTVIYHMHFFASCPNFNLDLDAYVQIQFIIILYVVRL